MPVGVLREHASGERRVALTPEVVASLIGRGMAVSVEAGAGEAAGFADDAYREAGAGIESERARLCSASDVLVAVQRPAAADIRRASPETSHCTGCRLIMP